MTHAQQQLKQAATNARDWLDRLTSTLTIDALEARRDLDKALAGVEAEEARIRDAANLEQLVDRR